VAARRMRLLMARERESVRNDENASAVLEGEEGAGGAAEQAQTRGRPKCEKVGVRSKEGGARAEGSCCHENERC